MTGIYANNFALNYEIALTFDGLPRGNGLKISLKSGSNNIVLKKSSKEIQFPA